MIDGQTHAHTHTHAGNDNTRRPKLASGKNERIISSMYDKLHMWVSDQLTFGKYVCSNGMLKKCKGYTVTYVGIQNGEVLMEAHMHNNIHDLHMCVDQARCDC